MIIDSRVIIQQSDQPLSSLLEEIRGLEPLSGSSQPFNLVHVVNPFSSVDQSQLTIQNLVIAAMQEAAAFASGGVRHVSVTRHEDRPIAPASFLRAEDLDRTVLDLGSFNTRRPLPLLFDILDRGVACADPNDYVIYSNMDICPLPHFYLAVRNLIALGFDAMTITRRSIADTAEFRDYPALAASDLGSNHPGFDCLIFRRSLYSLFAHCDICIGVPPVARALLYNMVTCSQRMLVLKNTHLTYHLGDDRAWLQKSFADYFRHNVRELDRLMRHLAQDPKRRAVLLQFCERHPEPDRLVKLVHSVAALH